MQGVAPVAPEEGKGAYVFVAALGSTDTHYFDLILSSLQCMHDTHTKYDVGIIWDGENSDKVNSAFEALGVIKFQVGHLDWGYRSE